jgi:hypothetical protein
MKTLRVSVTAEDIAAADTDAPQEALWWSWPVKRALEALVGVDVDLDCESPVVATIGYSEEPGNRSWPPTLVIDLDVNASDWLDARWTRHVPGEPFFFELSLPDWLCALVDGAS